jgi:acid phosphatase (class A)
MRRFRHLLAIRNVLLAALMLMPVAGHARERGGNYISNGAVNLRNVVPDPPAPGTSAGRADLDAVIAAQTARTTTSIAQAQADRKRSIKAFGGAIGGSFSSGQFPLTTELMDNAVDDARGIMGQSKGIWRRERPFRLDRSITPCVKEPDTASYPSSHATSGYVMGLLLAEMLPEKAGAIRARANEFANGRLVCGVHFPTDISAGQRAAEAIVARLKADQRFSKDYAAARREFRRGLGYAE